MPQQAVPEPNPKQEIVLNYIDKVHNSLTGTLTSLNRVWIFLILFSSILIFLCFGIVNTTNSRPQAQSSSSQADTSLSFSGFDVTVPFSYFLIGGTWTIGIFFIYMLSLEKRRELLVEEITELYKSIDYVNCNMKNTKRSPLEIPNMMTIIVEPIPFGSVFYLILSLSLIFFTIIPLLAIIACAKTIVNSSRNWWTILIFIPPVVLIFVYAIFYFVSVVGQKSTSSDKEIKCEDSDSTKPVVNY